MSAEIHMSYGMLNSLEQGKHHLSAIRRRNNEVLNEYQHDYIFFMLYTLQCRSALAVQLHFDKLNVLNVKQALYFNIFVDNSFL